MWKTAVAVLFLCSFAVFCIALKTELRGEKSPVAALKIGEPMADFELPDQTRKTVKLSEVTREQQNRHSQFLGDLVRPLPRGNAEL